MQNQWCGCVEWYTIDRPRPITRGEQPNPEPFDPKPE
jgi:hypothetical protein